MPAMNQLCPTCGQMRRKHPNGAVWACPVPRPVIDAVRRFKLANGRRWKAALRDAWTRGDDIGQEMQQARNMIGPRRLDKIDV